MSQNIILKGLIDEKSTQPVWTTPLKEQFRIRILRFHEFYQKFPTLGIKWNILYWLKYSTDLDKIWVINTMNHDCYPPKILCKSDMIFIGFCNLKIIKFFWLEENFVDGGGTLTGLSISLIVSILTKSPISIIFCINKSCKILFGVQKFFHERNINFLTPDYIQYQ